MFAALVAAFVYCKAATASVRPACQAGPVFTATSYGPPWGGINGGGTTAAGVGLGITRRGTYPRVYGIAVDPRVISLGSSRRIWPNPFRYRGRFRAFDTGGAIKGNRLDFYDWRGRSHQYGWGVRKVKVCR